MGLDGRITCQRRVGRHDAVRSDAFMDEYSKWHGSWCLIVCGIILKEPVAVAKLAQSAVASASQRGEAYSADEVFGTWQDAARAAAASGKANEWALEQITRQGVARLMGVSSSLQVLGVVATSPRMVSTVSPPGPHLVPTSP